MSGKYQGYFFIGKQAEERFRKVFGDSMREATYVEDRFQKFDMVLETKIDYKMIKKQSRWDKEPNENLHWVELLNVEGKNGWLYGEADFFMFEINEYWLVIEKLKLQELMRQKIVKEYDEKGNILYKKALYRLYQRSGRKDLITLVPTVDLCYIATSMIPKQIENDNKNQVKAIP